MTELLYMGSIDECYVREFESSVVSTDPANGSIVLGRTAFYPEGGGQPSDAGTIGWGGSMSKVRMVRKVDGIRHFLEGELPPIGTSVRCSIDWERRYSHMRMHTSQHLVSAVMWDLFSSRTVGNQIHSDRSHMDLRPSKLADEEVNLVEERVNSLIGEDHPVTIVILDRSRIESSTGTERTDLSRLPPGIKELRTVLIGREGCVDLCPCAGTHVRRLSEIVGIKVLKRRAKGAETVRLEYTLLPITASTSEGRNHSRTMEAP